VPVQCAYVRHVYSGFEPSQVFDVVSGGRFEHRLLVSKRATMEHQRLTIGELRLETSRYDFPVIARGRMPRDAVCIGLVAEGGDATRCNTVSIGPEDIQIYPSGAELLYHASASSRWITFAMPEERLQEIAMARRGRQLALPRTTAGSVRLPAGGRAALTALADGAMRVARLLQATGGISPDMATAISLSLTAGYIDALVNAVPVRKSRSLSTSQRHHHLIVACERLVLAGEEADVALFEIARRSGYSLRALELIFRHSVGMTPGNWFMNVRLNGVLRDLMAGEPTGTVADVAAKWGFRHMSRFSGQYRKTFGELPSQTLNRSREPARLAI